jgi:hypothetical protein
MSRHYKALTHEGRTISCSGDSPLAGMRDAAAQCGPADWPVSLYAVDARGALVEPVWGARRGLAGEYPPGETPEDAARLFRRGGEPA